MAFIIKDRVKESVTSTGTGAVSLGGATATFDTFQSYMTNGDTTYYAIVHTSSGVDEWEVGLGTWNTGNTLTRTTVLAGSNGASAVNFSAGVKDVFMTYPAAHAALAGDDVTFANISVTGTVDGRDVAADGTKLDTVEQNADVTDTVNVAAAGALMKSGGTMTGNLILNADPTAALGAATKEYVDTIASAGIHYHDPVRVEAPVSLTVTYNNGTNGVGATLTNAGTQAAITIDGVALSLNDRVLIYEQTDATQNGIYTVTTIGSASTNWVLTRSTDADSFGASDPNSFGKGDAFFVKEGNTGAGELYVMTTAGTITFGTTAIHFSQVAETAVYNAGTGLTLTGTTFSIGQDVATSANVTFNQVTADIIGNVVGNLTGDVTGNADTATALETARTIQLTGDVTGSATFDGTANATITATVQDDSHSHIISNVDGLQTALDAKADDTTTITAGSGLTGGGNLTANRTISHADTSTQASLTALTGAAVVSDVDVDTYGHVTGLSTRNMTLSDLGYTGETNATADQTITAGSGLTGGGTGNVTLNHADTSSQGSVNNSGATVIQDVTLDTYGHVTNLNSTALTPATIGAATSAQGATADSATQPGDNISTLTNDAGYTTNVGDITGVTAGSGITGGGTTGTVTINHADTSSQASVNNSNGTVIQDITLDTYGHLTGLASTDLDARYVQDVGTTFNGTYPVVVRTAQNDIYSHPSIQFTGSTQTLSVGGNITIAGNSAFHDAYHPNADKWTTARTLSLTGDASGSVSWDGSGNASLSVTVADNSHNHTSLGSVNFNNGNLSNVNRLTFNDPGPNEGLEWIGGSGWKIYESPDNLTTNSGGNLQFVQGTTREMTLNTAGSLYTAAQGTLWGSSNDGSGSGLDADLLDGVQGSSYLRSDADDTLTGNLQINSHVINMDLNNINDNAIELREVRDSTWPFQFVTNDVGNDNHSGFWVGANGYPDMRLRRDDGTVRALISSWETSYVSNGFSVSGGTLDMNNNDIVGVDQIIHEGDTNTYMQFHAADQWRVVTGGAERLEVNNSQITSTEPVHAPSFHGDGSNLTGIESGAKNDIFWENGQTVTTNYTITNGKNAMSAGPITINSGVTVTVGAGEVWTVI